MNETTPFESSLYINSVTISPPANDGYAFKLPVVSHIVSKGGFEFKSPVTIFMGENGCGKSTLLEAIAAAYGFNPEGGSKNFMFSTRASHSELYRHIHISKGWKSPADGFFLRAESYYNAATYIEELDKIPCDASKITGAYGGVSLHEQSHGESFMALALNRFFGNGLYILDEPEAALSPSRQLALLARLCELAGNSQLIIATHSVILSAIPDADIFEITSDGIKKCRYKDTEHYNIMRHFICSPEKMLDELLS